MKTIITFLFSILAVVCFSQESKFTARISSDSILIGNYIEVRFEIENADGEFEAPTFDGFEIVTGPNVSSSVSIINGDKKEQKAYSYYIKPMEEGKIFVGEAFLVVGESGLNTEPTEINVYPNPEGIIENSKLDNFEMNFGFDGFSDFDFFKDRQEKKPSKPKSKVKRRKI